MYVLFDYCFRQRLNNEDVEVNETCCAFFEDNDVIKVWEEELYL